LLKHSFLILPRLSLFYRIPQQLKRRHEAARSKRYEEVRNGFLKHTFTSKHFLRRPLGKAVYGRAEGASVYQPSQRPLPPG